MPDPNEKPVNQTPPRNAPLDLSKSFRQDLQQLLNLHNRENASNTPDFLLANYLRDCLNAFDQAVIARDRWYRFSPRPGRPSVPE